MLCKELSLLTGTAVQEQREDEWRALYQEWFLLVLTSKAKGTCGGWWFLALAQEN